MPEILTVREAALLLRVHPNSLYALAATGRIPCRRVGRQYRFSRTALELWLEGQDSDDASNFIATLRHDPVIREQQ